MEELASLFAKRCQDKKLRIIYKILRKLSIKINVISRTILVF